MTRESRPLGTWNAIARGDVRLDHASDDFAARRLRGDDEVDASRAGLGGEAGDGTLDVGGRGLHEIGQLVDDDDDVGELVGDDEIVVARHADGRGVGDFIGAVLVLLGFLADVDVEEFELWRFRRWCDGDVARAGVEAADVAHTDLGQDPVPAFPFH